MALAVLLLAPGNAVAFPRVRTGPNPAGADLRILRSRPSGLPGDLAPPGAGGAHSRERYANLSIPVRAGSAYRRLQVVAWKTAEGTFLAVATYRFDATSNSNQFFERQFRVPPEAVDIANDLSRVSIHSGDALGNTGFYRPDLSDGKPIAHRTTKCSGPECDSRPPSPGGSVSCGTVDLSLGIDTIPDPFQATAARGSAGRETFTGATCPHPRQRCYPYAGFGAWDKGAETSLLFDREGTVDVIREDTTWRSTSLSWFSRYPTSEQPVTITHDSVTFDGTLASPFLDGVLTFDRSGPPTERMWGPCRFIRVPFVWTSGILDILWDTGTQTLGGPWRRAQLYRWRRP